MDTTFVLYFVVPVILGVVILLAGGIFLTIDARRKKKDGQVDIYDWASTGGKINSVKLNKHEAQKEDTKGLHIDINYEPFIEYSYTVNDVEYHSNKVFAEEHAYFSQKDAQAILDQHPVNTYVKVKYDPKDPSISAIEQLEENTSNFRIFGLVLTSFGFMVCCFISFIGIIVLLKIR